MRKSARGFTLVELIIVIAIIGILSAISIGVSSNYQKQARDTQRKSDLSQYRSLLEVYANSNSGLYPTRNNSVQASTTLCSDLGLTSCPEDSKYPSDNSYKYQYQSDGSGGGGASGTIYALWSKLETTTSSIWVVCSNGKSNIAASSTTFVNGACPF